MVGPCKMVSRSLKYYICLDIGSIMWVYGKGKKTYNLLADMFVQPFIDFAE